MDKIDQDGSTWVVGRTTFLIITVFLFCVHSSLSVRTALWVETTEITNQVVVGSSKGWKMQSLRYGIEMLDFNFIFQEILNYVT